MIFLLLPIIVGFLFYKHEDLRSFTILATAISGITAALISICVDRDYVENNGVPTITAEYELKTIIDNSSLHGDFTLGNGVVRGQTIFSYYQEEEDGSYSMNTVPTTKARVYFTNDGSHPTLKVYTLVASPVWWAFGMDDDNYRYEFFIPEGSIDNIHHLDIQ